jgi:FtsP/CotA-like multicopper oxidase with cupredoxin domain
MSMQRAPNSNPSRADRRRFLIHSTAASLAIMAPALRAATPEPLVLRAAPATQHLGWGEPTPVWCYNGVVPGPEIRVRQGQMVDVLLDNRLEQETAIHWHGIRIDNAMDGAPHLTQEAVAPGESFHYRFQVPDAGSYWYHSHQRSHEQVGRGLYGVLVVEEDIPYPVDRELTLVVDDWRMTEDGRIDDRFDNMHDISHAGRLGNWMTVNGDSVPDIAVTNGERLRLRLVNVANSRIVTLHFQDQVPWVIALDGQPVAPITLGDGKITLAPGQRADLVLDVTASGAPIAMDYIDERGVLTIAHLVAASGTIVERDAPPPLAPNPLDTRLDTSNALEVELMMRGGAMGSMQSAIHLGREMPIRELVNHGMAWSLNGTAGMTHTPLFQVQRGRTVVMEIINDGRWPHAMHLHGHHFRVIERNGEALPDSPWRDTTLLYGMDRNRIAFVADNPGKWMLHCHMLEHAEGGMMTWFEVL